MYLKNMKICIIIKKFSTFVKNHTIMEIEKAHDMTNEEYHGDTSRISKSGLVLLLRSPLHYWQNYLNPQRPEKKETPALFNGTAIHMALLEPELFKETYLVFDDSEKCAEIGGASPRSTKKYKDWYVEFVHDNEGKKLLDKDQYSMILAIVSAVKKRPVESELLAEGWAEKTLLFKDNSTGCPLKVRPDWISKRGFIVDIKSTEDASAEEFGKTCINYGYDIQGALYSDGYKEVFGEQPQGFIFIAVEKQAPHGVAIYYAPKEMIDLGRKKYKQACAIYTTCKSTKSWPGYPEEVLPVKLPGWAFTNFNN